VQDRSIAVNDQILYILNESGIDMKLHERFVNETNKMEGVGVAHKTNYSQSSNHTQTIKKDKELSKKIIKWINDKFGETRDEKTITVPNKTTKSASQRIVMTTPIDVKNITRMIKAIPFHHFVDAISNRNMVEGGAVDDHLNIEGEVFKRPHFIFEAR